MKTCSACGRKTKEVFGQVVEASYSKGKIEVSSSALCSVCYIKTSFGHETVEEIRNEIIMEELEDQKFRYQGL